MAEQRELGVGIIGTGWVAGAHIENFNRVAGCKVVAICSSKRERAQAKIAAHHLTDATAYESLNAFLKHPNLDIVVIASTHPEHPAQTIAAARAGKHIVIEKPVALNGRDLSRMLDEVKKANVLTSVCFELRWIGLFKNIRALLDQDLLGPLFYGECSYHHGIGPWYGQWRWNIKKDIAGSALLTAGCHALDALLWFMQSRVIEVAAMSNTSKNNPLQYEYDPNSIALLRFENGAIGKVATSVECRQPYLFPILLQGPRGSIHNDQISTLAWPGLKGWAKIPADLPDSGAVEHHPYQGQFEAFAQAIATGKPPHNDLASCAHVHDVCFAVEQALKSRKVVKVHLRD